MISSVATFAWVNLVICIATDGHDTQVALDAHGLIQPDHLLRKEPRASLVEDEAVQAPSPSSDFDSSSGIWKEIRKRAKVTAVEPFSADVPPTVVYTAQTASAASTILMGTVTLCIGIFCMTQSSHKGFNQATWKSLSCSISIFSALLVYHVLRESTNLLVEDDFATEEVAMKGLKSDEPAVAAHSGDGAVVVAMLRFVFAFGLQQAILVSSRQRKMVMMVSNTFGAQLVGLLCADAFATWQETPYWSTSPGVSFGLVCVTVLLLALCLGALPHLRNKVITDQQQQAQCREGDDTVAAWGISLTLAQFWRFVLAGQLPHYLGLQRSKYDRSETSFLFLTWIILIILTALSERAFSLVQSPAEGASRLVVLAHKLLTGASVLPRILAMTAAWCCFFWAKWLDYGMLTTGTTLVAAGEVMKAEMYNAMVCTGLAFCVMIGLLMLEEKAPQFKKCFAFFCESSMFTMCLAWNSAFQVACAFSKDAAAPEFEQVFTRCTQSQWMCIVLIPAWLLFMVPRVMDSEASKDGATGGPEAEGSEEPKAAETPKEEPEQKEAKPEEPKDAKPEAPKEEAKPEAPKEEAKEAGES
ncbi:unnamed protein product [Effrenium voratum]|uniref:Uncharacterized protein n=1 Tax=Effrenium voratum TaxID=2562239 RepID=A0AA36MME9_9DINO|nr:unnamed protein product [Effrenium voratum]CAJ1435482.1 unnamed protein product [Effrenium voratum]